MPSQSGYIEKIIPKFFSKPGFFIEIGCWDGEIISQTKFLEIMGWRGICVDPLPLNFHNRTCKLVKKAIDGEITGVKEFIKVTIDRRYGGIVSYLSGFKDSITASKANWDLIQEHCDYCEIPIETLSVKDFFHNTNPPDFIDFLSVDVEGAEYSIMKNIDYEKYRFGVIMFEHNGNKENKENIGQLLSNKEYVPIKETNYDDVFVHRSLLTSDIDLTDIQ